MRPEPAALNPLVEQFLRLGLRRRWQASALDGARAVCQSPGFDWAAVRRAAAAERIAPLLYHTLQSDDLAPPQVLQAWRDAYLRCAQRNLVLFYELGHALRQLQSAGLAVIALKGAVLVPLTYGNPALRPVRDFDLLVRRENVEQALSILDAAGYRLLDAEARLENILAFENEVRVGKPGPELTVLELHWSLLDSPYYQRRLSLAELWQTTHSVEIGGASTHIPATEWHLLYLCAHLWLHHRGWGLLWWIDVAELIRSRHAELDWRRVLAQAQENALVMPLQRTLSPLAADWAIPIPPAVLRQAAGLRASPDETRIFDHLTAARRPAGRRLWHDLAATPGWPGRLRFAWANLFPSPAYMRQRYNVRHGALLPAYYLWRWYLGLRGLF